MPLSGASPAEALRAAVDCDDPSEMEREERPAERGEGARAGEEVDEVAGGWDWMRGLEKDCWVRVGGGGSCESSLRRVASKEDCLSLLEVDLVMALVPEIAGEVLPDDDDEEGTGWGRDEEGTG